MAMIAQTYPEEFCWLNATLRRCGEFLTMFCLACLHADWENYELLRPVVHELMKKYPADPGILEEEREWMT